MNIELVKYYIPFMQALADGKEVYSLVSDNTWVLWDGVTYYAKNPELRIKKEPLVFYGNLMKGRNIRNLSAYSDMYTATDNANAKCDYEFIAEKFVQVIDE